MPWAKGTQVRDGWQRTTLQQLVFVVFVSALHFRSLLFPSFPFPSHDKVINRNNNPFVQQLSQESDRDTIEQDTANTGDSSPKAPHKAGRGCEQHLFH